ncbi:MAG: hypothetical protein EXS31_00805 [Pedosphaera sp.]|nr:hypothetical protein [Pedosphaera sp.]
METLALLKSDLNYVRVELLTLLIATNQNALDISVAKLHDLSSNIDTSFARASKQIPVEEVARSLAEVNATWQEFRQTRDIDLISAVRSGDIALAKQLAYGVQKRRFNRFIEQTGGAIDVLTLKIVEFEKRASEKVAVTMRLMLLIFVIPTAIALSLAFMIIGSIEKPLFEVMKAIAALGNGDLSKSCSVRGGLDERTDAWR